MRGSRNFRQGAGVYVNLNKKALTTLFVCCLLFFLVLSLFYSRQMVNFKEKYHFQGSGGGPNLSRGGGGPTFSREGGGSNCVFPIETHITCDFPGGFQTPCPPPSGSALGCDLFSYPVRKIMQSPLAPVPVSCNFVLCFQSNSAIKSCLELTA